MTTNSINSRMINMNMVYRITLADQKKIIRIRKKNDDFKNRKVNTQHTHTC